MGAQGNSRYRVDVKTGEVLAYLAEGHTYAEASRRFRCHPLLIKRIENGTRGLLQKKKADVYGDRIRALHKAGATLFAIQQEVGVSHAVAYEAVFGELPASYNIHRKRKPGKRKPCGAGFRRCRICKSPIDNANRFFCSDCHRARIGTDATNRAAV